MSDFNWPKPKPKPTLTPAPGAQDTHSRQSETSRTTRATAAAPYVMSVPSPVQPQSNTQVVRIMALPSESLPTDTAAALTMHTSLLHQTKPLILLGPVTLATLAVPTAAPETTIDSLSTTAADDPRIFVLAAPTTTPDPLSTASPSPSPFSFSILPPAQPHNLSSSAILGITVGTIALASLLIVLAISLYRRHKRAPKPHPALEQTARGTPVQGLFHRAHALGMKPRLIRLRWEEARRAMVAAQEKEVMEEAERMARDGVGFGVGLGAGLGVGLGSAEGSTGGSGEGGLLGSEWAARRALRKWPSGLDCHPPSPTVPKGEIGKAV